MKQLKKTDKIKATDLNQEEKFFWSKLFLVLPEYSVFPFLLIVIALLPLYAFSIIIKFLIEKHLPSELYIYAELFFVLIMSAILFYLFKYIVSKSSRPKNE